MEFLEGYSPLNKNRLAFANDVDLRGRLQTMTTTDTRHSFHYRSI